MFYLIDSANPSDIADICRDLPIGGVTTNPSLIAREKRDFFELLNEIVPLLPPHAPLHVQVAGESREAMIREARALQKRVKGELAVKIPVTREGFAAMRFLSGCGFRITATAVFTPLQALAAAECGADFVAPYFNRIENTGGDGRALIAQIVRLFELHTCKTRILAASFRNVRQVQEAALGGAHLVTLPPDILRATLTHPLTDQGVATFSREWKGLYGERGIDEL